MFDIVQNAGTKKTPLLVVSRNFQVTCPEPKNTLENLHYPSQITNTSKRTIKFTVFLGQLLLQSWFSNKTLNNSMTACCFWLLCQRQPFTSFSSSYVLLFFEIIR